MTTVLRADLRAKLDPLAAYFAQHAAPRLSGRLSDEHLELVLPTYRPLLIDPVTGLWNGQMRVRCLELAVEFAKMGIPVAYGEGDVVNLGGANDELNHSGANARVLKPFAGFLSRGLDEMAADYAGSVAVAFRHGGDEMSWFTAGVPYRYPEETLRAEERQRKAGLLTEWLDDVVTEIDHYVHREGLHKLRNGKDKYGPPGTGFIYGLSIWEPGMDAQDMLKQADERLCNFKRSRKKRTSDATAVPAEAHVH